MKKRSLAIIDTSQDSSPATALSLAQDLSALPLTAQHEEQLKEASAAVARQGPSG